MAIAIASVARADYRTLYLDGITAYNNRSYPEAESRFRAALRERADENIIIGIRTPSGMRRAYLPHFYLGAALARQGRCDDARPELAASVKAGVLSDAPREREEYRAIIALCPEPARNETAAAAPPAISTSSTVGPPPPTTSLPEDVPRLQQETVASAPQSNSQRTPSEARPLTPPSVAETQTDARTPAIDALGRAFEFLVRGKYVEAIAVLNGVSDAPARTRAQVHLLRAAAEYSLYEFDGQARPELRAQAVEDAIAAAALLPDGRIPKPTVFTPKFLRFYQQATTPRDR